MVDWVLRKHPARTILDLWLANCQSPSFSLLLLRLPVPLDTTVQYLDPIWTFIPTMANCSIENTSCLRKRPENLSKSDSAHPNKRPKQQQQQHNGRDSFSSTGRPTTDMKVEPSLLLPSIQSLDSSKSSSNNGAACYASVMTSLGFKMA
jgi:hypothetical protein